MLSPTYLGGCVSKGFRCVYPVREKFVPDNKIKKGQGGDCTHT